MDGWRAWWQAVAAWVGGRSRAARVAITGRLAWLARRFAYARLLGWGLQRTGFAVAFAIIVPVLLLSSPGTDYIMGRALSDARLPGLNAVKNWAAAVALVGAWVLAAWFWSLVVLVSTPAEREPLAGALSEDARLARVRWMQRWLASWVAGAGGVLAAVVFARIAATIPPDAPNADGAQLVLRLTAVALLGVTVAALIFANRMAAVFRQRRARAHVAAMVRYHEAVRQGQPASLPDARDTIILWRWIVCLGGGAVLVGFLLATAISPDWTGTYFGALNLVLVAAMAWIGLGTTVVLLGDAWAVPLVGFVATWFVLVTAVSTQHNLPRVAPPIVPPTLEAAWSTWVQRGTMNGTIVKRPLVLVATAGGGMRAAYWTATVLGKAQDLHANFDNSIFTISGVSGGAVGATVYAALAAHGLQKCKAQEVGYAGCGQAVLSHDLLGPTVAGFVFTDVLQGFLPSFGTYYLPDRAAAWESALSEGWREAIPDGTDPFAQPMADLYPPHASVLPVPELLLNGTSVQTGTRVITASMETPASVFRNAIDARNTFSINPSLSAAGLNSARFPYVTPVAGVTGADGTQDQIADGGYFENFGAATTEDVLHWLHTQKQADLDRAVSGIVVIAISSDDALPGDPPFSAQPEKKTCPALVRAPTPADGWLIGTLKDLWAHVARGLLLQGQAPVLALYQGREAHGTLAAWRLYDATVAIGGTYIPFRLTHPPGARGVPLSWYLSDVGQRSIRDEMGHLPDCAALASLDVIFRTGGGAAATP